MGYYLQPYGEGHIERHKNQYRYVVKGEQVGEDYASVDELVKAHPLTAEGEAVDGGYAALKVDDLKAEIQRRNEGREDADKLSTDGKKDDLIATLEADDSKKQ